MNIRKMKIRAKKRNRSVWFGDYEPAYRTRDNDGIQQRYSVKKRKRGRR
jgi:hypothetical protein